RFRRPHLGRAHERHDALRRPLHRILMVVDLPVKFLRCLAALAMSLCALVIAVGSAPISSADPTDGQWDPTLPKVASSGAPGDPVAMANASFAASQIALQTTQ